MGAEMNCPICQKPSSEWILYSMIAGYYCDHIDVDIVYWLQDGKHFTCYARGGFGMGEDYYLEPFDGLISPERLERLLLLK